METEIVDHLLALSASHSKTTKEFEGFEKIEDQEQATDSDQIEDSRVPESITPPSVKNPIQIPKRSMGHFKEGDVKLLVTQVVDQLAPMIKSMSVTEKMLKVQVKQKFVLISILT